MTFAEERLASKQDEVQALQDDKKAQQAQAGSFQAAMATLQRQLQQATTSHSTTEQQLLTAQTEIADHKQQLAESQASFASNQAAKESSDQSVAALQQGAAQQAAAITALEAKCQSLLAELDLKDEQLKQASSKLTAAEHAAAAAQEAAGRLQTRLTGQQTAASDQSQELTEALQVGSENVHQLEATIQALQDKVFAAEHAMESQQDQLLSHKAAASDATKHAEGLAQQLNAKDSLVTSLQSALDTANFVAESNQQLVNTLQETHTNKEADADQHVASFVAQLQLQTSENANVKAELSKARGQLAMADAALAAARDQAHNSAIRQSKLDAKVAQLTQLLDSKEHAEWLAKTSAVHSQVNVDNAHPALQLLCNLTKPGRLGCGVTTLGYSALLAAMNGHVQHQLKVTVCQNMMHITA